MIDQSREELGAELVRIDAEHERLDRREQEIRDELWRRHLSSVVGIPAAVGLARTGEVDLPDDARGTVLSVGYTYAVVDYGPLGERQLPVMSLITYVEVP